MHRHMPTSTQQWQKSHLEALRDIDLDALGLRTCKHLVQHDVCNLLHLCLGELAEHDDLIQPVQEFGPADTRPAVSTPSEPLSSFCQILGLIWSHD